jgi:hypothetical protein
MLEAAASSATSWPGTTSALLSLTPSSQAAFCQQASPTMCCSSSAASAAVTAVRVGAARARGVSDGGHLSRAGLPLALQLSAWRASRAHELQAGTVAAAAGAAPARAEASVPSTLGRRTDCNTPVAAARCLCSPILAAHPSAVDPPRSTHAPSPAAARLARPVCPPHTPSCAALPAAAAACSRRTPLPRPLSPVPSAARCPPWSPTSRSTRSPF